MLCIWMTMGSSVPKWFSFDRKSSEGYDVVHTSFHIDSIPYLQTG
jgi:hypothetical protein